MVSDRICGRVSMTLRDRRVKAANIAERSNFSRTLWRHPRLATTALNRDRSTASCHLRGIASSTPTRPPLSRTEAMLETVGEELGKGEAESNEETEQPRNRGATAARAHLWNIRREQSALAPPNPSSPARRRLFVINWDRGATRTTSRARGRRRRSFWHTDPLARKRTVEETPLGQRPRRRSRRADAATGGPTEKGVDVESRPIDGDGRGGAERFRGTRRAGLEPYVQHKPVRCTWDASATGKEKAF